MNTWADNGEKMAATLAVVNDQIFSKRKAFWAAVEHITTNDLGFRVLWPDMIWMLTPDRLDRALSAAGIAKEEAKRDEKHGVFAMIVNLDDLVREAPAPAPAPDEGGRE